MFRRPVLVLFLAALTIVAGRAQQAPRLAVIVVVDQFRAEYLTAFASHWRAGLRALLRDGAVFENARYPYLHTDTCAGHFTISTGTQPRTHGMIADNWWDSTSAELLECTDDPGSTPVTYGRPTERGKSARNLLVPSLADELRSQHSGARVVTLSMKARGAIGLAGHGGNAITWFEETPGVMSFVTSRAFSAQPVPAVKAFLTRDEHAKEFGTAWNLRDAAENYRFPDAGVGERPLAPWSGLFPHAIKGTNADQTAALWRGSPLSDAYLSRMGIELINAFSLGQRNDTDFLGISFSATDFVGHAFGPESREVEDTVARLDDALGALLAHLDARVGRERYVLALSADHGGGPVPVTRGAGRVATEDIRDRVEETLRLQFGPPEKGPYVVAAYTENIYLAPGTMDRLKANPAVLKAVERAVTALPGVERILRSDEVSERSSDETVRAAALTSMAGRGGDLIVIAKPYWLILGRNSANAAGHGTAYDYDQRVPMVFLGGPFKAGRFGDAVTPADIAPTLASAINVRMPKAEGNVLKAAFR